MEFVPSVKIKQNERLRVRTWLDTRDDGSPVALEDSERGFLLGSGNLSRPVCPRDGRLRAGSRLHRSERTENPGSVG